jgi:hypothetical protein
MTKSSATVELAVPILVLGEARRRALTLRLTNSVKGWLQTWGANGIEREITVDLAKCGESSRVIVGTEVSPSIRGSIAGVESLAVTAGNIFSALINFPRRGVMPQIGSESKIAASIQEDVLRSLADAIVADLRLTAWAVESVCLDSARQGAVRRQHERWWTASVGWGTEQCVLEIAFSPALLCQLAPLTAKANIVKVEKRRAAIGEESVSLEAILGEATVSLGELASLAVNDVIVLRDDPAHPSYLATRMGIRVANVSIGRVGDKRAAMIVK